MASPNELDLLGRSLSGDWQSRIALFRKFFWDNSRVRRLSAAYPYLDDFLHDCFTNVLRTAHSFNKEENFGDWVASVAAWTALDHQRLRDDDAPDVKRRIRMCAGTEGDEADGRARLTSYVPPRSGPEDSPASRIAALVGQPQFTMLSKRAIEGATWQGTADAAGKPLNAIGPALVRTVDQLSRFFGAPPPLNVDLEPAFEGVRRQGGVTRRGDVSKLRGRIVSMELDPGFYSVTPEMRSIGLSVPAEVRTIALWDAARTSTAPGEALRDHLAQCHYCADLLRALRLMQQAVESGPDAGFLLCPGGFTLLNTPEGTSEVFDGHLAECAVCRQERSQALGDEEQNAALEPAATADSGSHARAAKVVAWVAAALLLLAGGYFAQHGYFTAKKQQPAGDASDTSSPAVAINARYRDLAQHIDVGDMKWLTSVLPENRHTFSWLVTEFQSGHTTGALLLASGLGDKDPGVEMLYGAMLSLQDTSGGYSAMLKAEAMPPRNSFRCWVTLQVAIVAGDVQIATREVEHLSGDPEYAGRAKDLLARIRARG